MSLLEQDAKTLANAILNEENKLSHLPEKPKRDAQETQLAQDMHARCRQLRLRFLDQHAAEVYAVLTQNLTHYHRLSDLVFSAAERFQALVPTRQQMEAERCYTQANKEGREIDQGLFFRALLRLPLVSAHLADAMLQPCPRALRLLDEFRHTDRLDLGSIFLERRAQAVYLTLNNQYSLNAEDQRLIDDMETAVDLVLLDERVKVGVLRGGVMTHPRYQGKRVFCSGLNLADLHAGKISFVDFILTREFGYISKIIHGLIFEHNTCQKPWIAAVDSFAIGGGMQLLLAFDHIIAADDAYFSLPAAQEGIVPGAANFRLGRLLGSRLSRQVILSGRQIFASDADARYVCDEVVPSDQIDVAIDAVVQAFSSPAVVENRSLFAIAEEPRDRFCAYMAEFSYVQATRLYSPDVLAKMERWAKRHLVAQEDASCL